MAWLRSRVVLGGSVAAALIAWAPGAVAAQPAQGAAPPSAADKEAARKLVIEANAALDAKQYDQAIERYQRAYDLTRHPLMLFNIAQAHRLADRADEALTFYEQYLKDDPDGSEAAGARLRVEELKAAGAKVRPELLRPAGAGAPAVEQDVPAPVGATPAAMPALQPDGLDRTDTVGKPGRTLRLTGLVLGGVGVASVGAGSYFGLKMRGIRSDAEADAGAGATDQELEARYLEDGNDAARSANIAFAVGGALIVGGAVTYWLGVRKDRAAETTAWAPVVGPGFTGIAVSGSLP
jgi:tetratricopeptide (TPR) repeat protein